MTIKCTNIFLFNTLQNFSENWDFWLENMPSGNPVGDAMSSRFSQGLPTSELPDFSWYKIPKQRKYTKLPQNIPNDH
jgi:hypothetical protein